MGMVVDERSRRRVGGDNTVGCVPYCLLVGLAGASGVTEYPWSRSEARKFFLIL